MKLKFGLKQSIFSVIGWIFMASTLSSCLSESYDGKLMANQIGLIAADPVSGKHLMEVYGYGTVYDPIFDTELKEDSCYLINFMIDTLSSENTVSTIATNGYKTVKMQDYLAIDKGRIRQLATADTALLLTNEQVVVNPVARSYVYHEGGRLILVSSYNKYPGQTSKWYLTYDPENPGSDENGKSLYTVYLRSVIDTVPQLSVDSLGTSVNISTNAFDVKSYMNQIRSEEASKGRSEYYLRIRYLSTLKLVQDTLRITWSSTDSLLFKVK